MHRIALKLKNLVQNSPDAFFGEKLKKIKSATLNAVVGDFSCLWHIWMAILSLILSYLLLLFDFWGQMYPAYAYFLRKKCCFYPIFQHKPARLAILMFTKSINSSIF